MTKTGKPAKQQNFCYICKKIINGNSYKFKAHLFKHDQVESRYKCEFCSRQFFRRDAYILHIHRHMGKISQKKYICDYCDRPFVNKYNLIKHLKRIHDDNLDTKLGDFPCHVCNQTYCEQRLLEQHIRRVHFNVQRNKEPSHLHKLVNETWIERVQNQDACVSMTKVNNNVIVIKQLKLDVKVNDFKPSIVDKAVVYKSPFDDQYSKGTCDYCQKIMLKKSLRLHIREVHMNIRKHTCTVCKASFTRHYQLIDHNCGRVIRKPRRDITKQKRRHTRKLVGLK